MVRLCLLCQKLDHSDPEITFHRFPKNEELRNIWCSLVGIDEDRLRIKPPFLCSAHFNPQDYLRNIDGVKYLKPGSLPIMTHRIFESESSDTGSDSLHSEIPQCPPLEAPISKSSDFLKDESSECQPLEAAKHCSPGKSSDSLIHEGSKCPPLESMEQDLPGISSDTGSDNYGTTECPNSEPLERKYPVKRKRLTYPGDLGSSDFSTPTKRRRNLKLMKTKLKTKSKKIKTLQRSVKRLKFRVTNLKSLLQCLRVKQLITEQAEPAIAASLSGVPKDLFERLLRAPARQKYNENLRSFALTLSFYSPKAYEFVRDTFNNSLPDLSTISKWFRTIDGGPGFTQESLLALRLRSQQSSGPLLASLVYDEMSIRKLVEWTGRKFTGYVDVGTNLNSDTLEEAREALVFLVTCVNGAWKVPVGYFLINRLSAIEKSSLIKKCLEFLHDEGNSGVTITSITFDGPPVNFRAAEVLGANLTDPENLKTDFPHPVTGEPVFLILDPCHMMKLVRNCFASQHGIGNREDELIEWRYIEQLVELQNKEGLHAAVRVSHRHLNYKREIMKVKLAAQTLSRSVSDALSFLRKDLQLPKFRDSSATADFIRKFNDIFDILNSRNYFAKYSYKRPFSPKTEVLFYDCFTEMNYYIRGLTLNGKPILNSGRKTGFLGILICIESVSKIYEFYVKEKKCLKYLLTYKLSQFSVIRSKGGFNNNPSARQFEATYKRLLVQSQLRASKAANVVDLDTISILTCGSGNNLEIAGGEDLQRSEDSDDMEREIKEQVHDCLTLDKSLGSMLTSYADDIVAYIFNSAY